MGIPSALTRRTLLRSVANLGCCLKFPGRASHGLDAHAQTTLPFCFRGSLDLHADFFCSAADGFAEVEEWEVGPLLDGPLVGAEHEGLGQLFLVH